MDPRPDAHFPKTYRLARHGFLQAAEARGAQCRAYPVAARGAEDEELALDAAYLGPDAPASLLVVSSGVHGVEGFAGSAVQHQLLREQLDGLELPGSTGLLLVHAVNPYGFSALRRVNETNVDLNRNFLEHPAGHVPNPGYDALQGAINPQSLDPASEEESRRQLLAYAQEHGVRRLQEVLTCGQYVHPSGVQFGGEQEEASNRRLREIIRKETRGAGRIAWIDVHTGLGPYGVPEMITESPRDDPEYQRGRVWYGDLARSTVGGESASAALNGVIEQGIHAELPGDCEITAFAAEFGTYEPTRVFWAMRADNWLHGHGDPDSEAGRGIKAEILEVFRPADPAWQASILSRGAALLDQAKRGLTGA